MLFTHSFHCLFNFFHKLRIDTDPNCMTVLNAAIKTLLHEKLY